MLSVLVPITIPSVMRRHTLRLAFEASVIRMALPGEDAIFEMVEQIGELWVDAAEMKEPEAWS